MLTNNEPSYLTIKKLFSENAKYTIPIYQRNYAWDEPQIAQLIQDVYDVSGLSENGVQHNNYYLGSLIVHHRDDYAFETIDGQQRLTTLNIFVSVLKNLRIHTEFDNTELILNFDSRKKSQNTIRHFNQNGDANIKSSDLHPEMLSAYRIIVRKLNELFHNNLTKENNKLQTFIHYFLNNVKILRITVPEKTDLNHYFEVMNNRGEQLEKHEILKARMLNILSKNEVDGEHDRQTFNLIWEACFFMDRYVQYVFTKEYREPLFGKFWNEFEYHNSALQNFETIKSKCLRIVTSKNTSEDNENNVQIEIKPTLQDILKDDFSIKSVDETVIREEGLERFNPITSFSHFLLQVLRVTINEEVALDDKQLINEFDQHIIKHNDPNKVKTFAFNLLKCKFLFDNFIIKRDYKDGKDGSWAILKLKKQKDNDIGMYVNTFGKDNNDQKKLILLQSMFHVSFPQTNYKHWLSATLKYVFDNFNANESISVHHFIQYLEQLSDAFYFDRFNDQTDYKTIIFDHQGQSKIGIPTSEEISANLDIGTNVQNFIFNRLDYLLCYNFEEQKNKIPENNFDSLYSNIKLSDFEFSFRSSVEHYAPQNPKNDGTPIKNLDFFGNLCLISRSKNSELSNYSPTAKKEHYGKSHTVESLKQRLMMCYKEWNENTVIEHKQDMIALLNTKHPK